MQCTRGRCVPHDDDDDDVGDDDGDYDDNDDGDDDEGDDVGLAYESIELPTNAPPGGDVFPLPHLLGFSPMCVFLL